MSDIERNRDVYLNFGLIAYGPLREIEKLQERIRLDCKNLKVVYQTVSAKKLYLVKRRERFGEKGKCGREGEARSS